MTEVVCNLLMNNVTTNKFKQLKSSVTEEHTVCAVSWPFIHCLHNLFTTSLAKKLLDCQQAANVSPAATHCTILQFLNSTLGCFLFLFLNPVFSALFCKATVQCRNSHEINWILIQPSFFVKSHNSASVSRRDPGFHVTLVLFLYI